MNWLNNLKSDSGALVRLGRTGSKVPKFSDFIMNDIFIYLVKKSVFKMRQDWAYNNYVVSQL